MLWLLLQSNIIKTSKKNEQKDHLVNTVAIGEQRYLIDAGFGSSGPHQPVPPIDGVEAQNVGDQSARLIYGTVAQYMRAGQRSASQAECEFPFRLYDRELRYEH